MTHTLRALQSSTKTSLRIDDEGLLSLQFLVPVPKPRGGQSDSFIEFRVRPITSQPCNDAHLSQCLALDEDVAS